MHEAQGQAHRYRQQPYEHDFQYNSSARLVSSEFHWVPEAQVTVYADRAQMHYASRAEQYVQTYPR